MEKTSRIKTANIEEGDQIFLPQALKKSKTTQNASKAPELVKHQASNVIYFHSVHSKYQRYDGCIEGFHPHYTHQVFENECIFGPENLRIDIFLGCSSLSCCLVANENFHINGGDEVLSKVQKFLPENCTRNEEEYFDKVLCQAEQNFCPIGEEVYAYSSEKSEASLFKIYQASGRVEGAKAYHDRVQTLAIWFIESADFIDLNDDRWEVFYIYETQIEEIGPQYFKLVGYVTVFNFQNPIKGCLARICQALVLPPFQKKGHGSSILKFINQVMRERPSVTEVTVEDPAPAFKKLRDVTDLHNALDFNVFTPEQLSSESFESLDESELSRIQQVLKITKPQVVLCYEALKLRRLELDNEELLKKYRLMVKRRLHKEYKEELNIHEDKTTRQKVLSDMYVELQKKYQELLKCLSVQY